MNELQEHPPKVAVAPSAPATNGHALPLQAQPPQAAPPQAQPALSDRVRSLRFDSAKNAAPPRRRALVLGLGTIALALAALYGWRQYRTQPASDVAAAAEPRSTGAANDNSPVAATSADPAPAAGASSAGASGDVVLDSKGYIIAAHQIQLSPQVGGQIIWIDPNFKEGAIYKKGDRLAEIDPQIYAAQLNSAKAALQVAQTNLTEVETGSAVDDIEVAKLQLKNLAAKLDSSKIDDRYNEAAGIAVSRHDKEKSAAQVRIDQAAYDAQKETVEKMIVALEEQRRVNKAQVQSAQASVDEAQTQLSYCTITAPTTGVILTKKAELGGYVNPLAQAAAIYLCEIADLTDLEVELDIQERDISRVFNGQRCRIMPEAGQQDEAFLKTHPDGYAGYVSRRMPMANRSKGAVTVRVKVEIPPTEAPGQYLLPDMGALVSFLKTHK